MTPHTMADAFDLAGREAEINRLVAAGRHLEAQEQRLQLAAARRIVDGIDLRDLVRAVGL